MAQECIISIILNLKIDSVVTASFPATLSLHVFTLSCIFNHKSMQSLNPLRLLHISQLLFLLPSYSS